MTDRIDFLSTRKLHIVDLPRAASWVDEKRASHTLCGITRNDYIARPFNFVSLHELDFLFSDKGKRYAVCKDCESTKLFQNKLIELELTS